MHAYVRIDHTTKSIISISSIQTPYNEMDVILDEEIINFNKINAYFVYTGEDEQAHLKLDEDKYNDILRERERQEQIYQGRTVKTGVAGKSCIGLCF